MMRNRSTVLSFKFIMHCVASFKNLWYNLSLETLVRSQKSKTKSDVIVSDGHNWFYDLAAINFSRIHHEKKTHSIQDGAGRPGEGKAENCEKSSKGYYKQVALCRGK